MRYSHEDCARPTKVYADGEEIKRVVWVDVERTVLYAHDDPLKINRERGEVESKEYSFERIEITRRDEFGRPSEFRCYGRLKNN